MNYFVKLNLRALNGAFVHNLKSEKTNVVKKCLILPLEECGLVEGEKGVYLNVSAFERDADKVKYGKTHSLRLLVDKAAYDAMSEADRKEIPFVGDMMPVEKKTMDNADSKPPMLLPSDSESDLPF